MTSIHSLKRAKERLGFNQKFATRFIERGITRGKTADDYKRGDEKTWLERHSRDGCKAVVYNGTCLVVGSDDVCLTIYELPRWFGRRKRFDNQNYRVRNTLRYLRMHEMTFA